MHGTGIGGVKRLGMTGNPDPGFDETVPPWLQFEWPVHGHLERRLGIEGVRRLGQLLSESGGLTPPEAKPWFDLNRIRWHAIMRILATGFYHRIKAGFPPPPHVMRWMERFVETDSPDTPAFWNTHRLAEPSGMWDGQNEP